MRRFMLLAIDLLLVAAATFAALILRNNFELSADRLHAFLPYLGMTVAIAAVVVLAFGLNRGIWRLSGTSDYLRVIGAVILTVLGAVALGFLVNRLDGVARSLPVLQGILMVCALIGARVTMRLRHAQRSSFSSAKTLPPGGIESHEMVLVVGLNTITELYLRAVQEFAAQRVRIAGLLGRSDHQAGRLMKQHKVLGTPEEISNILRDLEVHGVVIERIVVTEPLDKLSLDARNTLLEIEKSSNVRLDFFAERIGLTERSIHEETVAASRVLTKTEEASNSFGGFSPEAIARRPYWRVKRAIDFCLAAILIVLLAPVFVIVAMLVMIDVGLPTVFWQQRPGAAGRPFRLFKFRTMKAAHDQNGGPRPMVERLTNLGRFLRRTRLDELPQLYNILIGEMSFVGPRPLLPVDQLSGNNQRLLAPPGLTGWAQVNGGRDISPATKTVLDLWYLQNASLRLDLKIALGTLRVLIVGEKPNRDAIQDAYESLGVAADTSSADGNDLTKIAGQRRVG